MSTSLGIDLVSADDVAAAVHAHGERYLKRVYTPREREDCQGDPQRLAARFAAKEATIKALGPVDEPLPWGAIGVRDAESDEPELELSGAARAVVAERRVSRLSLCLTHRKNLAAAVVLAEVGS